MADGLPTHALDNESSVVENILVCESVGFGSRIQADEVESTDAGGSPSSERSCSMITNKNQLTIFDQELAKPGLT